MTFEADGIKVVHPLDLGLVPRYIEPMDHNMESDYLDQLYTLIAGTRLDFKNPIAYGLANWRSIHSVDKDSKAAFDSFQQGSYERFLR
jgi:hypothetical protein